jgi:hypothetical protein
LDEVAPLWLGRFFSDCLVPIRGSCGIYDYISLASTLSGSVSISNSQWLALKRFNLDWPRTLMASIGTIASSNDKANAMRVRIAPRYQVKCGASCLPMPARGLLRA